MFKTFYQGYNFYDFQINPKRKAVSIKPPSEVKEGSWEVSLDHNALHLLHPTSDNIMKVVHESIFQTLTAYTINNCKNK